MMNIGLFTSTTPEWATPQAFFDELNNEFHFTLDPCSTHDNAKCTKHYTREDNGLLKSWEGEIVFCNPPYGKELPRWVEKCRAESIHAKIVMLLPARTDTRWFHDHIYHHSEIRFVKGRLKFNDGKTVAPFPSMVVIF